jgi:hypothetical protein
MHNQLQLKSARSWFPEAHNWPKRRLNQDEMIRDE